MNVLGLDIGGANIKACDFDGNARSLPFAMWQRSAELTVCLRDFVVGNPPQLVGLTMTAELADCFASKADGVRHVVNSVQAAFPDATVRVWLTSAEFAEPDDALDLPELVAAANWHALATWAGRAIPNGPAILIDIGSTTTDIIPLIDGLPVAAGRTDCERLQSGELVYTGVRRTPLCAVRSSVDIDGRPTSVAAELFATTQDVHVLRGDLEENPETTDTADGRPLTRKHCLSRVARMVCCDRSELSGDAILRLADQFAASQVAQVAASLRNIAGRLREQSPEPAHLIISGSGSFLAKAAADQCGLKDRYDLDSAGHSAVSESACAFAIVRLVHERCHDDLLETVFTL